MKEPVDGAILITGGTGFPGVYTALRLAERGEGVIY